MTDDQLREFVDKFLAGQIVTDLDCSPTDLPLVFMPIAFGALQGYESCAIEQIGRIYGDIGEGVGPRTVNGHPMFGSMRVMHKDDWDRAKAAITREKDRRSKIDV